MSSKYFRGWRYEIEGTDLTFELRDDYLRLYEGWSEEYVIIRKEELNTLCNKLSDLSVDWVYEDEV